MRPSPLRSSRSRIRERAGFPGGGSSGIVEHFSNVDLSVFIENHLDRTQDVRLAGKQLDSKIVAQTKTLQSSVRGKRRSLRGLLAAASQQNDEGDEQEPPNCTTKLRHWSPRRDLTITNHRTQPTLRSILSASERTPDACECRSTVQISLEADCQGICQDKRTTTI